jgi:hypothetical protein
MVAPSAGVGVLRAEGEVLPESVPETLAQEAEVEGEGEISGVREAASGVAVAAIVPLPGALEVGRAEGEASPEALPAGDAEAPPLALAGAASPDASPGAGRAGDARLGPLGQPIRRVATFTSSLPAFEEGEERLGGEGRMHMPSQRSSEGESSFEGCAALGTARAHFFELRRRRHLG